MLGMPETSFADPETNTKLDEFQLGDWLEGCITFADDTISQNDVVDVLHENYLTNKTNLQSAKNDAAMRVEKAWRELGRRVNCLGKSASYSIDGVCIKRACDWEKSPAFAFCLLVGLRPVYRKAFKKFEDYTQQGELFEQVTVASLNALGWDVHSVGWSKTSANSIADKVHEAARFLGIDPLDGATETWTAPNAKDAGLDVICQYVFVDRWGGRPVILTQCASGENWEEKLHSPDVETWKKLMDFHTVPTRGLSMPFAIRPERFRRAGVRTNFVLLLDRHRLAVPEKNPADWIPAALSNDLRSWMVDRVTSLQATAA